MQLAHMSESWMVRFNLEYGIFPHEAAMLVLHSQPLRVEHRVLSLAVSSTRDWSGEELKAVAASLRHIPVRHATKTTTLS